MHPYSLNCDEVMCVLVSCLRIILKFVVVMDTKLSEGMYALKFEFL